MWIALKIIFHFTIHSMARVKTADWIVWDYVKLMWTSQALFIFKLRVYCDMWEEFFFFIGRKTILTLSRHGRRFFVLCLISCFNSVTCTVSIESLSCFWAKNRSKFKRTQKRNSNLKMWKLAPVLSWCSMLFTSTDLHQNAACFCLERDVPHNQIYR